MAPLGSGQEKYMTRWFNQSSLCIDHLILCWFSKRKSYLMLLLFLYWTIKFFLKLIILDLPKHELFRKLMQFFYIPLYSLVKLFNMSRIKKKKKLFNMSLLLKKKVCQFHIETSVLKLSSSLIAIWNFISTKREYCPLVLNTVPLW